MKVRKNEKWWLTLICLLAVNMVFAQNKQINGCSTKNEAWETVPLTKTGEKTLIYNFKECGLDVSAFRFMALDVVNNSNAKLVVDLEYSGEQPWFITQGRFIVDKKSKKQGRVILTRKKLPADSPWMSYFKNERGLPGNYVRHWFAADLTKISSVKVTLSWDADNASSGEVKVKKPYGAGDFTFPELSLDKQPMPMLDDMGQYKGDEWDGKLKTKNELEKLAQKDKRKYIGAKVQNQFSKYGGWKNGPKFKATGFFYTKKHEGKWWFVDPEGHLFWSQGVTGAGKASATSTKNREELFPTFDAEKKEKGWKEKKAAFKNQSIDFYDLNLIRKYGKDWKKIHEQVTIGRMKNWGMNTCGAWSPKPEQVKHPYTLIVHPNKQGIGKISKMVDPFSDDFKRDMKMRLKWLTVHKNDPWLLGVFVNNELHWRDEMAIPNQVLTLKNDIPARRAFEDFLQKKYNKIEALNNAWGTNHASFATINKGPVTKQKAFKEDMHAYLEFFAETYYSMVAEEFKKVLPNHLYFGSRLHDKAKKNAPVQRAASRHCDVVSFNVYQRKVAGFKVLFDHDKPAIIGEFHFGTASHGVWGTGLRSAYSLENQANVYQQYIKEAAEHPNFVGAHWFQWSDQLATGRGQDGENFRIGLVNITDQPYEAMVKGIQETSSKLYQMRSGK